MVRGRHHPSSYRGASQSAAHSRSPVASSTPTARLSSGAVAEDESTTADVSVIANGEVHEHATRSPSPISSRNGSTSALRRSDPGTGLLSRTRDDSQSNGAFTNSSIMTAPVSATPIASSTVLSPGIVTTEPESTLSATSSSLPSGNLFAQAQASVQVTADLEADGSVVVAGNLMGSHDTIAVTQSGQFVPTGRPSASVSAVSSSRATSDVLGESFTRTQGAQYDNTDQLPSAAARSSTMSRPPISNPLKAKVPLIYAGSVQRAPVSRTNAINSDYSLIDSNQSGEIVTTYALDLNFNLSVLINACGCST